jgi:hypothetical protein
VKEAAFDYTDKDFGAGENYFYVHVLQDGQIAWSSPIWVKSDAKPALGLCGTSDLSRKLRVDKTLCYLVPIRSSR